MSDWQVRFTWLNSYGDRKGVTTTVPAKNERTAESAARSRIGELYGIRAARLVSVEQLEEEAHL